MTAPARYDEHIEALGKAVAEALRRLEDHPELVASTFPVILERGWLEVRVERR